MIGPLPPILPPLRAPRPRPRGDSLTQKDVQSRKLAKASKDRHLFV